MSKNAATALGEALEGTAVIEDAPATETEVKTDVEVEVDAPQTPAAEDKPEGNKPAEEKPAETPSSAAPTPAADPQDDDPWEKELDEFDKVAARAKDGDMEAVADGLEKIAKFQRQLAAKVKPTEAIVEERKHDQNWRRFEDQYVKDVPEAARPQVSRDNLKKMFSEQYAAVLKEGTFGNDPNVVGAVATERLRQRVEQIKTASKAPTAPAAPAKPAAKGPPANPGRITPRGAGSVPPPPAEKKSPKQRLRDGDFNEALKSGLSRFF